MTVLENPACHAIPDALIARARARAMIPTMAARANDDDHPFGRILTDINAGRQHNANQYEVVARNWGLSLLGLEPRRDLAI